MTSLSTRLVAAMAVLSVVAVAAPLHAATNIFAVLGPNFSFYLINGVGNPTLRLVRGFDYTFNLNAGGHPFWIKTVQSIGAGNAYNNGVTGNGTDSGVIQFSVPTNAPSPLFYICQYHASMTGTLILEDPPVVRITTFNAGTNTVLKSTGTDALNVMVESRSDLVTGTWLPTEVIANEYSDGTNTTQIELPSSTSALVRIRQGFQ